MRGAVVLLTAFSLLTYRSIRVQNLSPLVAVCLILTVFCLLQRRKPGADSIGAAAMALAAGLKLASFALAPLAVAMRQWRMLALAAVLTAALVLLARGLSGPQTFKEYFTNIGPTLGASTDMPANKSLQGFLLRITGMTPLPKKILCAYRIFECLSLGGLLWLIFRHTALSWQFPSRVFAASAGLICWMLIFSPICWEHYFSYLCPFWGWLVWEATQSTGKRIAATATIVTQWVPLPLLSWLRVPEPVNSYMLWGLFAMLGLAVARLAAPAPLAQSSR